MKKSNLRLVGSDPNEDAWDIERQRYAETEKKERRLIWMLALLVCAGGFGMVAFLKVVF